MKEAKHKPFITMTDLRKTKFPESNWVVADLLRTGLRRPALLAAKPETGKSTMARQLVVAVSQGKPFLGRSTTRGAVIYWQTEDDVKDVLDAFNRLGSKDGDEQIYVLQGDPESSECQDIAAQLETDQNINLVVIETLDDLLRISDIKENTAARAASDCRSAHPVPDRQMAERGIHGGRSCYTNGRRIATRQADQPDLVQYLPAFRSGSLVREEDQTGMSGGGVPDEVCGRLRGEFPIPARCGSVPQEPNGSIREIRLGIGGGKDAGDALRTLCPGGPREDRRETGNV